MVRDFARVYWFVVSDSPYLCIYGLSLILLIVAFPHLYFYGFLSSSILSYLVLVYIFVSNLNWLSLTMLKDILTDIAYTMG